jgi:glyoxylase-like metal-dependent hydrolase (beta-lactamase superfamily II)/rhodanese-related sulfurtransferase
MDTQAVPQTKTGPSRPHVHVERLDPEGSSSQAFLVADLDRGEAAILDPLERNVDAYLARLQRAELRLVAVIDTHTHADHVSGAPRLARATGAPIVMHHQAPRACVSRRVHNGDEIAVGALRMQVIATPGHTYDSMSLLVGDELFPGDLLELGAQGHGDEACGDVDALVDSLRALARLPASTQVHGSHGPVRDVLGHALRRALEAVPAMGPSAPRSRLGSDVRMPTNPVTFAMLEANLACDVADETASSGAVDDVPRISADDLAAALRSARPPVVIDVRSPDEFFGGALGRIPGALLVPLEHLGAEVGSMRQMEAPIVVVCRTTARALLGAGVLANAGVAEVSALAGGILAWKAHGHPIEIG